MTNKEKLAQIFPDGIVWSKDWLESKYYESTSEIPNKCEDAISRQAVLDLIYNSWKHNGVGENYGELSIDALKALPPVTPKQKMGKWIIVDDCEHFIAKCSECGRIEDSRMIKNYPYCHCGAKMAESEDKE